MEYSENINLIQKARCMFPNMPDEVFNTWLLPIIRDHNTWPYLNVLSPHPSRQWSQYFGLFTIYDVANLLWDKLKLSLDVYITDPVSNDAIEALIGAHVDGLETPARNVRDSKMRFFRLVNLIYRTRTVPAPIIGINTDTGFRKIHSLFTSFILKLTNHTTLFVFCQSRDKRD